MPRTVTDGVFYEFNGRSDLAKKVSPFPPTWHPPHNPLYFPHYHPEGEAYGPMFYGTRCENFEQQIS